VVLTHESGTGDLVTDISFTSARARGFGYSTCQDSKSKQDIKSILLRVDAMRRAGIGSLSQYHRDALDSQPYLERLETIYHQAIAEWMAISRDDAIGFMNLDDALTTSHYLSRIKLRHCQDQRAMDEAKRLEGVLREEALMARSEADAAKHLIDQLRTDLDQAKQELAQARLKAEQALSALDQSEKALQTAREDASNQALLASEISRSKVWLATAPLRRTIDLIKRAFA
jgi:hypothetical protein